MKVYLIRHAESEYNAAHKRGEDQHYTERDSPLTEKGCQQARELGQSDIGSLMFDELWISPLARAQQTAKLAELQAHRTSTVDLVRECRLTSGDFFKDEEFVIETEDQILERVEVLREEIREYALGPRQIENMAIVAHGDLIWYLTSKIVGGDRFGTYLDNAQFTILTIGEPDS